MAFDADYRHRKRRPAITPLLTGGLVFWIALGSSIMLFCDGSGFDPIIAGALGLILAICLLLPLKLSKHPLAFCLLSLMAVGFALGAFHDGLLSSQTAALQERGEAQAILVLLDDSAPTGFGESALAELHLDQGAPVRVSAVFSSSDPLFYGDRVKASGRFTPPSTERDAFTLSQGICARFQVSSYEGLKPQGVAGAIGAVRKQVIENLQGSDAAHGVLQALICGYRRDIRDSPVYGSYQSCGLAHLIAVSGAHLVIVTALFAQVLKLMGVRRSLAIGILCAVMAAYFIFSGAPVSALRACMMSSVGILALFGARRPSSLNALGLCIIGLLAFNPWAALSASFTLSVLSTLGIVLFAPLLEEWFTFVAHPLPQFIRSPLSLSAASALLSQLYASSLFSLLPIISPVANIICAPLFTLVCSLGLGAAFLSLTPLPIAGLAVDAAAGVAQLMNLSAQILAALPAAAIPFTLPTALGLGISALLAFGLWLWWPRSVSWPLCLGVPTLLIALYIAWPHGGDSITLLDVGQGDALLLQSEGSTLLIDTGNKDAQLTSSLARHRITRLSGVLISHADDDHCGSLDALGKCVTVDKAFLAAPTFDEPAEKCSELLSSCRRLAAQTVPLTKGDVLTFGCFTLEVLWPEGFTDQGGNDDSLCFLASYDGDGDGAIDAKALFLGDAESEVLERILQESDVGKVDILKVAHHGSARSLTAQEAASLSPSIALIGVGAHNRYGHPALSTLEILEGCGCAIYRTDENGEVTCKLSPHAITVSSMA